MPRIINSSAISNKDFYTNTRLKRSLQTMSKFMESERNDNVSLSIFSHWIPEDELELAILKNPDIDTFKQTAAFQFENTEKHYSEIHINAADNVIQELPKRHEQYTIFNGLLAHEIGHYLYTESNSAAIFAYQLHKDALDLNHITIDSSNELGLNEIVAYCGHSEKHTELIFSIVHSATNLFEDIFVNRQMALKYPGSFKSSIHELY